ncbi:hypothetical protein R1flu_025179 [Riccia fluitans]|uniref:acylaminoacyl-peptidase n=1 Tax=Riccia fluitans TaxID=41844 RepID=A0ABD1XX18_9MARC
MRHDQRAGILGYNYGTGIAAIDLHSFFGTVTGCGNCSEIVLGFSFQILVVFQIFVSDSFLWVWNPIAMEVVHSHARGRGGALLMSLSFATSTRTISSSSSILSFFRASRLGQSWLSAALASSCTLSSRVPESLFVKPQVAGVSTLLLPLPSSSPLHVGFVRKVISRSHCRSRVVRSMDESTEKSNVSNAAVKAEANGAKEAELFLSFYAVPNIDKAWISPSRRGSGGLDVVVAMSQVNLHANAKRTFISTVYIPDASGNAEDYHWSPFPFELSGALLIVPSPSGTKLLIVRKADPAAKEGTSAVKLEIWGPGQLLKELIVPPSLHGSVYVDGWFEGVSWSHDEESIAYVAEEPCPSQPVYGKSFFSSGQSSKSEGELDAGTWKGQGDWMEDWGECYTGKRQPMLFVANINSGSVQRVEGTPKDISVGQVIWAPPPPAGEAAQQLVYVGWTSNATNFSTTRKLGMKYCYNRPCALYAVEAPTETRNATQSSMPPVKLTGEISSAFTPRFSPDGKQLVFLSAKAAVDSGAHCATNSLHALEWASNGVVNAGMHMRELVSVMMNPDATGFPGLYASNVIANPWLSDGSTLLLSSAWRSMQVILAVNTGSGTVTRITPHDTIASWSLLGVQDDIILAVCSSPTSPPSLKLGNNFSGSTKIEKAVKQEWSWSDISIPSLKYPPKVETSTAAMTYELLDIPIEESELTEPESAGAKPSFESIFVSPRKVQSKQHPQSGKKLDVPPLIVVLHGGPHSVSQTTYSRVLAFLSALGFSLLHVNYRGSLGFGEESVQSLLGNVGRQDVGDVLIAVEYVISKGLADREKIGVLGGSHGGFLTSHLIGQAPDMFVTGVLRNPVCNLSSMIGVTDIPDWCYVETFGKEGLSLYSEVPSASDLSMFYKASPVAHLSKVKVPTLFLLGAQDRRVPPSNGLQYVQALRARGLEVKVLVFPDDMHAIDRPQSEFESFLNVGIWFRRFLLST